MVLVYPIPAPVRWIPYLGVTLRVIERFAALPDPGPRRTPDDSEVVDPGDDLVHRRGAHRLGPVKAAGPPALAVGRGITGVT